MECFKTCTCVNRYCVDNQWRKSQKSHFCMKLITSFEQRVLVLSAPKMCIYLDPKALLFYLSHLLVLTRPRETQASVHFQRLCQWYKCRCTRHMAYKSKQRRNHISIRWYSENFCTLEPQHPPSRAFGFDKIRGAHVCARTSARSSVYVLYLSQLTVHFCSDRGNAN